MQFFGTLSCRRAAIEPSASSGRSEIRFNVFRVKSARPLCGYRGNGRLRYKTYAVLHGPRARSFRSSCPEVCNNGTGAGARADVQVKRKLRPPLTSKYGAIKRPQTLHQPSLVRSLSLPLFLIQSRRPPLLQCYPLPYYSRPLVNRTPRIHIRITLNMCMCVCVSYQSALSSQLTTVPVPKLDLKRTIPTDPINIHAFTSINLYMYVCIAGTCKPVLCRKSTFAFFPQSKTKLSLGTTRDFFQTFEIKIN